MTHTLTVADIINNRQELYDQTYSKIMAKRPRVDGNILHFKDYCQLFKKCAEQFMILDNDFRDFEFDNYTTPIVEQLYFHLTMNSNFKGELHKGIWLWGETGTGKSIIMSAYMNSIVDLTGRGIKKVVAVKIGDHVRNPDEGYEYFNMNMFIDDLGREERIVKRYGNESIPMMDIMFRIEKRNYFCLATSQLPIDKFNGIYGGATTRRFHQTFNELELKGVNRTLKMIKK